VLLPLLSRPAVPASLLRTLSAASLRLPGAYPDDPSAAVIYEKALDRQALYGELGSEVARKGMLLGHEMLGATTQSQLFDKVSKPGSWKKAYVKAILRPVEVSLVLRGARSNVGRSGDTKCAVLLLAQCALL
jgi:hypothetical protein